MIETQDLDTNPEQWQLDGSSAEAYERYLVPLLFAPGADVLIDLAEPKPGETVLDVACGTGIVARQTAPHVAPDGHITGLDLNDGMLDVARKAAVDIQPSITWRQGDALDLPFPDTTFDVVFCQQGLQFFSDRTAALREMHRVLRPEGRLAMSVLRSLEHNPGWALLADALERHAGEEAGVMMRSPFASFTTDDLRDLVTRAGFTEVTITFGIGPVRYPSVEEFVRQEAASSPLAGPIGSLPEGKRQAMIEDLTAALEPHLDDRGVAFPSSTYLVRAHR